MHESIRDGLEDFLKGPAGKTSREFHAHVEACQDCATELRLLEAQVEMLRSLKVNQDIEPRAGFYGRVMERIDERRRGSIWAVFLEPAFGRRLALTSAALVVALGTYLVTAELAEPQVAQAPSSIAVNLSAQHMSAAKPSTEEAAAPADNARQQQERDAVLVNLASFRQ